MLFQHTLQMVLSGRKTQTRRIIGSQDTCRRGKNNRITCVLTNGREKWAVGKTYAVQPKRGFGQVARIRITAIRSEAITRVSTKDAVAEGFSSRQEFLQTWARIHGKLNSQIRVWVLEFVVEAVLVSSYNHATLSENSVFVGKLSSHVNQRPSSVGNGLS